MTANQIIKAFRDIDVNTLDIPVTINGQDVSEVRFNENCFEIIYVDNYIYNISSIKTRKNYRLAMEMGNQSIMASYLFYTSNIFNCIISCRNSCNIWRFNFLN